MSSARSRTSVSSSRSKSRSSKYESAVELQNEERMVTPDQLAWQLLSQAQVTRFRTLSPSELTREMATVLSLNQYKEELQQAAILDYFVASFAFALESNFSDEQTSAFITLIHRLVDNIKERHLSLADNLQELQSCLTGVGISDYTCLRCFTVKVAKETISYLHTSLVQHYKLFEYLFEETQETELIETQLQVSLPPDSSKLSPPPLEEAVTEEFYNRALAPPPPPSPSPSQEERVEEIDSSTDTKISPALLLNVTPEELKLLMKQLASESISTYEDELEHTLKDRETNYMVKFEKLEKAFS